MNRRLFLSTLGAGGLGVAGWTGWRYWPDQGVWNPCLGGPLPSRLAEHELIRAAWEGIDPEQLWDCHVHLIGTGDSDSGIWVNPVNYSLAHPFPYIAQKLYSNASCAEVEGEVDVRFVKRMMALQDEFPPGSRLMLLAFDYYYDEKGKRVLERTLFHIPNGYAERVARQHPQRLEWIASIHPYRQDAVEMLAQSHNRGARAIKWLPSAMGMDPASPLCDRFYEAMAKRGLPLLVHAGGEAAVHGPELQQLNNPLKLRRALDHGVRVIVAHCASLGSDIDLDQGSNGPQVASFELFARMMDDARYEGRLFADVSAMTQANRMGTPLRAVLARRDWHPRLVNGSDYPLPGVMPIFSMREMVAMRYITHSEADVLTEVRRYNALLFDFVLKRHIRVGDKRFQPVVFHSRRVFDQAAPAQS
ncbi:MAG: amidohydrolase family protein [Acidiferrobacterales bacterium]